jgi:hypothetical protein
MRWERVQLGDLGLDIRIILNLSHGKKELGDMHWILLIQLRDKRPDFVKSVMGNWV